MDGKHDRSELADRVAAAVEQGEFEVQFNNLPVTDKVVLGQVIEAKLERLGRMALLVA
jgi:hypothetical protein